MYPDFSSIRIHALEVVTEKIAVEGMVTFGDLLSRLPCSHDETLQIIEQLVGTGDLVEIQSLGAKPAERRFIRPGTKVSPIGTE